MFKINNREFPYPNDFTMESKPHVVAKITTLSGRTIGDVRGWEYSDRTFVWAVLTTEELTYLINTTNNEFDMTFDDIAGGETTVKAVKKSQMPQKSFTLRGGKPCFLNIEIGVEFPDVYK